MRYLESLREGENVNEVYLVKAKKSDVTKTGKPYYKLTLQDKTGACDGFIWDPNSPGVDEFDVMDYVFINASVNVYQNANQLNIKRVRKVSEGEYNPADYLPVSSRDITEMYKELLAHIGRIKTPYLKTLLESFFVEDTDFIAAFQKSSAAKSVHHGFMGGLLEHTLSVTNLCSFYAKIYPDLKGDLLVSAAILHDVGKVYELSSFPQNDYTDDGQLLGHIVMGSEMVGDRIRTIPDFPKVAASELKHCILAHHGEYEYGSPKKPALMEALALHFADNLDAKMETWKELRSSSTETDWMGFNKMLDSNVRKTSDL